MTPKTAPLPTKTSSGSDHALTPKGDRTREAILAAAARLFAERGFDGVGIREIESAASVKRGVVTYHLGNKEDLWKASAERTFAPFIAELKLKADVIRQLEPAARVRYLIRNFIETSAQHPQLNQLMIQESLARSWRIDWIIENYLRPIRATYDNLFDGDPLGARLRSDPNLYYAFLGACMHVFSIPAEVRAIFGADPFDPEFVERHVETVIGLFEATGVGSNDEPK